MRQVSLSRIWTQSAVAGLLLISALSFSAQAQEGFTIEPVALSREAHQALPSRISDFSGLEVPRFASLKYNKVNGRAGPGTDYPVRWVYERQGLPVMVIRESKEWRKIRDPQGDEVWVHRRMLGARRTAITAAAAQLRRRPSDASKALADIDMGVVADLADCKGSWCQVQIVGETGWLPKNLVWGSE